MTVKNNNKQKDVRSPVRIIQRNAERRRQPHICMMHRQSVHNTTSRNQVLPMFMDKISSQEQVQQEQKEQTTAASSSSSSSYYNQGRRCLCNYRSLQHQSISRKSSVGAGNPLSRYRSLRFSNHRQRPRLIPPTRLKLVEEYQQQQQQPSLHDFVTQVVQVPSVQSISPASISILPEEVQSVPYLPQVFSVQRIISNPQIIPTPLSTTAIASAATLATGVCASASAASPSPTASPSPSLHSLLLVPQFDQQNNPSLNPNQTATIGAMQFNPEEFHPNELPIFVHNSISGNNQLGGQLFPSMHSINGNNQLGGQLFPSMHSINGNNQLGGQLFPSMHSINGNNQLGGQLLPSMHSINGNNQLGGQLLPSMHSINGNIHLGGQLFSSMHNINDILNGHHPSATSMATTIGHQPSVSPTPSNITNAMNASDANIQMELLLNMTLSVDGTNRLAVTRLRVPFIGPPNVDALAAGDGPHMLYDMEPNATPFDYIWNDADRDNVVYLLPDLPTDAPIEQ